MRLKYWLSVVGVLSLRLAVGCGDDASASNDVAPVGDTGGSGGGTGNGVSQGGTGSGGTSGSGGTTEPDDMVGTGATAGMTVGEPTDGEDGGTSSGPVSIAGTGTACYSYTPYTDSTCGSYYCGVDLAKLTAAIPPGSKCGMNPAYVCKATLPLVVGACARKVKSAKPFASNATLRPQVRDCAYQDPEVKAEVSEECLGCYMTSAECGGDKCLIACLAGDSPSCDACLIKNNCTQPVFTCNGLPNPL